jgi:signal transduction histidine kinase
MIGRTETIMGPSTGKWRYALTGILTALLAATAAATAVWYGHEWEERQARFVDRYWDVYLSDLYALSGSWTEAAARIGPALTALEQGAGGKVGLAVRDADGRTVFAGGTLRGDGAAPVGESAAVSGADEMRPILAEGRIVGYFQAAYEAAGLPARFWAASTSAAAAVGAGWLLILSRLERRGRRALAGVGARLDRMLAEPDRMEATQERGAAKARASRDAEAPLPGEIADKLARLEARLYLLERVRKTMVADIAHELRTPIAVVRAKLENALLREEPVPPEQVVLLHNEIYRVSKLIRDLNALALAEAGRLPLERSWFSLKEMMELLVETFRPEAEEAGIAVSLSGFDSPCSVYADRERLQQVFVNLLGNALRYARSTIVIACAQDDAHIRVAVRDDGVGIEEEDLPYVFDRFYRSPRASAQDGGRPAGLGLGLAIVKEFVQAHGGSVSVESRWNEGSVFRVALPVFRE